MTLGSSTPQPGEQDPENLLGELIIGLIILIVAVWLVAKLADAFQGQFANDPELTVVEKQILASA